jgi:hypothetical protein
MILLSRGGFLWERSYTTVVVEASPETTHATFAGKLKKHCPSLFFSLSAWEHDQLDPSSLLEAETTPDALSGIVLSRPKRGYNPLGVGWGHITHLPLLWSRGMKGDLPVS